MWPTMENIKADIAIPSSIALFSLSLCLCMLSIFFSLMHSLQLFPSKCDYLPFQTHITLTSMWKREAWGESKGRENRIYIAVDGSNWFFFFLCFAVWEKSVRKCRHMCQTATKLSLRVREEEAQIERESILRWTLQRRTSTRNWILKDSFTKKWRSAII